MKKRTNKIIKYLGLASLPLILAPMAFGINSNISTKATDVEGTVKTVKTQTIFDKTWSGVSSNEYKSTLTLQVTNNLNLLTDELPNATLTPNTLAFYGTIDFSNATKKDEMKIASETFVAPGIKFTKGFRSTILPATSSGDSALASTIGSTTNNGWLTGDTTDYKVSFVAYTPSFDSIFNFNLSYATNGNFLTATTTQIISSTVTNVSIGKAGTNFDQYTKIIPPITVTSWKVSDWNEADGSYSDVEASLYVDPSSYGFLKAWESASNPVISGGLFVSTITEQYIIDLGNITANPGTEPDENNLINLSFGAGEFALTDTFLYNEKNPTWNIPILSPVDLTGATYAPYFTIKVNGPGPSQPSIQLANPVNITGLDTGVVSTNPSATENNGMVEITNVVKAKAVNTYSKATQVVSTINSTKPASSIKTAIGSTEVSLTAKSQGLGIGFFDVSFELFNNNISLAPTVLKMYNGALDNDQVITPMSALSTSFSTNNTIVSQMVFLSKTVGAQISSLNLEKSTLNIYYDGKLVEKKAYVLDITPFDSRTTTQVGYTSSYSISTTQTNLALFSFSTTLYYDIVEGTETTTKKMGEDLIFQTYSSVSQYSSSSTGMSGGTIAGIVIGSIAGIALIGWIYSSRHRKLKHTKN